VWEAVEDKVDKAKMAKAEKERIKERKDIKRKEERV